MSSHPRRSSWIAGLLALALAGSISAPAWSAPARFELGRDEFLLNGQPTQLIGCEMHPARIPPEYWQHRLRMARAMGCNAVPIYLFWNQHEARPGRFDFKTGSRDIARFARLAQAEGLLVLLRPGPYVCGEWDLGGLPPYLLAHADIGLRGGRIAASAARASSGRGSPPGPLGAPPGRVPTRGVPSAPLVPKTDLGLEPRSRPVDGIGVNVSTWEPIRSASW